MSAEVIALRDYAIWVVPVEAWLVLAPRGHGWLFGSLAEARREAKWLAQNYALPIREIAS